MKVELNFFKKYQSGEGNGSGILKKPSLLLILMGVVPVVLISYLLYLPPEKSIMDHRLAVGDIVKEDVVIRNDITIEDERATEEKRREAVNGVIPVYEYYSDNQSQTRNLLDEWFKFIRQAVKKYFKNKKDLPNIKESIEKKFGFELSREEVKYMLKSDLFGKVDVNRLFEFLQSVEAKRILSSRVGAIKDRVGAIKVLSGKGSAEVLKVEDLYDLKDVSMALNRFLRGEKFSAREATFISSILMKFVDVNISYSPNLTGEEEMRVAAQVDPVLIKLKTDKVILRKGDEVKPEDKRLIDLIASSEEIRESKLSGFFLILGILGFLFLYTHKFFKIWDFNGLNRKKIFMITCITLTVAAVIYRICIFLFPLIVKNTPIGGESLMGSIYFAIPFGFGTLIIAFIFNLQSAVIFSFINAVFGGIICGWDFKIALYVLLGNLAVSYGIEYYQRLKRSPILKASLFWLLPVNIFSILLFNLTEPDITSRQILINMMMGAFSAVVSTILATFIIPLWEVAFKLITDLKLIELANLNLPIFREMLEKAPGTYHHSQMVASLSESAALDLRLSPLLLTTMALYHDIGKITNPQFFTENHTIYKNPHDKLPPRDSARMIITHITEGIEMAKKLKLPEIVYSSISQHHGTKLVRFFYDKAREMSSINTDEFDDTLFRYPGKKPQSIENAIVMLADQVEAASKTLASPTEEEIRNVIQQIIDTNIEENQFDECEDLTFKSLNIIANGFYKKLSSIYHMRISYPGFDFKEKKENGRNDRNSA